MKGLLIKDMKLMIGQKRFFLIIFGMGIILMFSSDQPSFAIGYITMLITTFSLNTISYDEHENGMSFLMTLPASRKVYVQEKYVFAGALAIGASILAIAAAYMISMIRNIETSLQELFVVAGVLVMVGIAIFAVTFPLMIKLGSEKGRMAMFAVFAAIGMIVAFTIKVLEQWNGDIDHIVGTVLELSVGKIVIVALFALTLVVLTSYFISLKIISKKEY